MSEAEFQATVLRRLDEIDAMLRQQCATSAESERLERPFTVAQFGKAINRGPHWVYEMIQARVIKTLPGGKPYRIPRSELERWNTLQAVKGNFSHAG